MKFNTAILILTQIKMLRAFVVANYYGVREREF